MPQAIGPYRIHRLLGEGGMGSVYEAVHQAIERRVAIKTLKPEYAKSQEAISRFFNEARAVNRIEHPSLVQISDYGQTPDGVVYLVMEYLRGESLRARLERLTSTGQRIGSQHAVQTAWQIAEALTAAHDKGIVHRDLKPDNVMLVTDPAVAGGERAKILDFGIAKLMQSTQALTAAAKLMGTPLYMAPEQCRGELDIDGRTDVYALGVILFEMLAGEPPFRGETLESILAQHLFFEPRSLGMLAPHTSSQLVELVHTMLRKDRLARPQMRAVSLELSRQMSSSSRPQDATVAVNINMATRPMWNQHLAGNAGSASHPSTMGQSSGQQLPAAIRKSRLLALLAVLGMLGLVGTIALRGVSTGDPLGPSRPALDRTDMGGKWRPARSPMVSDPVSAQGKGVGAGENPTANLPSTDPAGTLPARSPNTKTAVTAPNGSVGGAVDRAALPPATGSSPSNTVRSGVSRTSGPAGSTAGRPAPTNPKKPAGTDKDVYVD